VLLNGYVETYVHANHVRQCASVLLAPSSAQDLLAKRRRPKGMLREGRRLEPQLIRKSMGSIANK